MSTILELEGKIASLIKDVSALLVKASDEGNLHISSGSIISVHDDRQVCDVYLTDKNLYINDVTSMIPCEILNVIGHLTEEDSVLVAYTYPDMKRRMIVSKLQAGGGTYKAEHMPATKSSSFLAQG
jgi:hypothetical protein